MAIFYKEFVMTGKDNYGPGGFSDQYDNERSRSVDRDQNPGGVTGYHFEDTYDVEDMDFNPHKGEAFRYPGKRSEPARDADLSRGGAGTNWNSGIGNHYGRGPKDWKLNDQQIKVKVSEILLHSHDVDPSEMEIEVEDAVVTLKGFISSLGMKRIAEDLVLSIPFVEDVFTQLKIKNTSNFQLNDQ
jgi:hypothetical protein